MLSAANYQALSKRPDFVNLSKQPLTQLHQRQANLGQDAALVSSSYINFKLNALNVIKGDKGKFYNITNTQISGQEIALRLPNIDKPVVLYVDNVQNLVKGVVTYTGHRVEDSNDFFTLSVADEGVMAKINYGKYIYIIKPVISRGAKHTVSQLDKTLMIKDNRNDVIGAKKVTKFKNFVEKSSTGSGHVEVLFYYASDVYSPNLLVSGVVSEMNAALIRSGVSSSNYISSVGIKSINSNFSGQCKTPILNKMIDNQGEFINLDQDMLTYGADIAFAIVGDSSASNCYPGQSGRVGGVAAWYYDSTLPYVVSAKAYVLGDLTALHEIGHILGGKHSSDYFSINGVPASARGMTFTIGSAAKQTIMGAYDTAPCYFTGLYSACERVSQFTNPNPGYSLGSSTRNMVSWLNTGMSVVSGWRGAPIPPPNAPNPIVSNNEACFGLNTISWTAQPDATKYTLYKSTSSSFSSPVLLYSGTNTFTAVSVDSGTWYLRAQACNSIGCSVDSNQVSAYRISSCL